MPAQAGLRRLAAPVGVALILLTLAAAPLVASWRLTDATPPPRPPASCRRCPSPVRGRRPR